MIYEFREGLNQIRIELLGDAVSVTQKSPDSSSSFSFALAELSPTPVFAQQRDAAWKSAVILAGIVAFVAIIVVSMIRFSIGWGTFAVALGILIAAVIGAYFFTPTRHYVIFNRHSGVHAFGLKSRGSGPEFDAAVTTLTQCIAARANDLHQAPETDKG